MLTARLTQLAEPRIGADQLEVRILAGALRVGEVPLEGGLEVLDRLVGRLPIRASAQARL